MYSKIPEVKCIKSIQNRLYIEHSEGIYLFDKCIQDIDTQSLHQQHKAFLYYDQKGDSCILTQKELIVFEQVWLYPNTFDGQSIVLGYDVTYDTEAGKWRFNMGRFDVKSKLKIQSYELMHSKHLFDKISTGYLCLDNQTKISFFAIETGACQWFLQLEGKIITRYLVFRDHHFYFRYKLDSGPEGLMKVNARSGIVIWERIFGNFAPELTQFVPHRGTVINLQAGGLWLDGARYESGRNAFREIELTTGRIIRAGTLPALDALDLQIKTFEVYQKRIYFTANHQGSFGAVAVGILSLQTLQLLWWEAVEMQEADGLGNFLLNSICIGRDQFGILDKTHVLHLYDHKIGVRLPRKRRNGLVPIDSSIAEQADKVSPPPILFEVDGEALPMPLSPELNAIRTADDDDLLF